VPSSQTSSAVAVRRRGSAVATVEHAVPGSAEATELLYRRHAGRILRYCRSFLSRPADAEDALQQTFLQAHRALREGVQPVSEVAWLLTIARHVCLSRADTLRRRSSSETSEDPVLLADLLPAADAPEAVSAEVQAAFARLSERQRQALFLREWHGCSYAEIADALDTTESAVETLIFRARRALAAELAGRRDRRVPGLAGLLGWLRTLFAPAAAKVAVGAAVATVAGTAVTLDLHRPAARHEHAAAAVAAATTSVRRSAPVVRTAHRQSPASTRRARRMVSAPPEAASAAPAPASVVAPAPAPVPRSSSPAAPAPAPAATTTAAAAPAPQAASVAPPVPSAPPTTTTTTAAPTTTDPVGDAASAVNQLVGDVSATTSQTVDNATQTVGAVTQTVGAAAQQTVGAAQQTVGAATQTVAGTVNDATADAQQATNAVGSAVSKLLPGH